MLLIMIRCVLLFQQLWTFVPFVPFSLTVKACDRVCCLRTLTCSSTISTSATSVASVIKSAASVLFLIVWMLCHLWQNFYMHSMFFMSFIISCCFLIMWIISLFVDFFSVETLFIMPTVLSELVWEASITEAFVLETKWIDVLHFPLKIVWTRF